MEPWVTPQRHSGWEELRKVWAQVVPEAGRPRQVQAQCPHLLEALLASLSKARSPRCLAGAAEGPGMIAVITAIRMREALKARTREQMGRSLIPGLAAPTARRTSQIPPGPDKCLDFLKGTAEGRNAQLPHPALALSLKMYYLFL